MLKPKVTEKGLLEVWLDLLYAWTLADEHIEECQEQLKDARKRRNTVKKRIGKAREAYKTLNGEYPKISRRDRGNWQDPFDERTLV